MIGDQKSARTVLYPQLSVNIKQHLHSQQQCSVMGANFLKKVPHFIPIPFYFINNNVKLTGALIEGGAMTLREFIEKRYGRERGNIKKFLEDNPHILAPELSRWLIIKLT